MDIPHERKAALESLPVVTKRTLIRFPLAPTKDPGEYLMKLKHVMDAGKDYKVLASDSVRQLQRALALVCVVSASHALNRPPYLSWCLCRIHCLQLLIS